MNAGVLIKSMPSLGLFLVVLVGVIGNTYGTGHIEIHFIHYSDNCDEDLGLNKCDPMFSFCLSTPQTGQLTVDHCVYESTGESRKAFRNTDNIHLEYMTSILGHRNPWVVRVDKFIEPQVMLVIQVRDKDLLFHDHMQTWGILLNETIWPDIEHSVWVDRVMSRDTYTMRFRVRMYCDPYYYTSKCDKYCKPDDSSAGHFTCDPMTGNKVCLPGWEGEACTQDINECSLGYCVAGECVNVPGDFSCNCTHYYSGKNCTALLNACRQKPCKNGGVCYTHSSEHSYLCLCPQEWEGTTCENKRNPCLLNPCQNNGVCTARAANGSYSCLCLPSFYGANCEKMDRGRDQSNNNGSTDGQDTNMQHVSEEESDEDFHLWYIAVIVAVLVIVTILLIVFFVTWRKRKGKNQELLKHGPDSAFHGSQLAFENGIYVDVNRNNTELERQTRQLPAVPAILRVGEMNQTKPSSYTQGATGGGRDTDSLQKVTTSVDASMKAGQLGSLSRQENERAPKNQYADFSKITTSPAGGNTPEFHSDEEQYHDLDDITATLHKEYESDDGIFNCNLDATPVVTVQSSPYDTPSNNSSYYASPKSTTPPLPPYVSPSEQGFNQMSHPKPDNNNHANDIFYSDNDDNDGDAQEDIARLRRAVKDNLPSVTGPKK